MIEQIQEYALKGLDPVQGPFGRHGWGGHFLSRFFDLKQEWGEIYSASAPKNNQHLFSKTQGLFYRKAVWLYIDGIIIDYTSPVFFGNPDAVYVLPKEGREGLRYVSTARLDWEDNIIQLREIVGNGI